MTNIRNRAIVVIALLLVGAALADRAARPGPVRVVARRDVMPVAPPKGALSATWYCAGATAQSDGRADGAVVIANPGRRELHATVTVFSSDGDPVSKEVDVEAQGRASVRYADVVKAPYAAAVVELDGGEAVAEQVISGLNDEDASACAAAASDRWFFADGATTKEATLILSLFNPFPEDAIADLSFSTDQGRAVPAEFQGVVVPSRKVVAVNVGDHVRRRQNAASQVSVRSGRLIVSKTQLHNGGGRKGLGLTLGAPSLGTTWYFPDGFVAEGIVERYHVFNPSRREAKVSIELTLDQGDAEPFDLSVPPQGRVSLTVNDESRVPKSVGHSATLRSTNGVAVVAERSLDAASPASRAGFSAVIGARTAATRWALAAGGTSDTDDEWLIVDNTSTRRVTLSVTALAAGQPLAVEDLQDVEIKGGGRMAMRLGDHLKRSEVPIVIEADRPIVVERALYRQGGGVANTIGIPLR